MPIGKRYTPEQIILSSFVKRKLVSLGKIGLVAAIPALIFSILISVMLFGFSGM